MTERFSGFLKEELDRMPVKEALRFIQGMVRVDIAVLGHPVIATWIAAHAEDVKELYTQEGKDA